MNGGLRLGQKLTGGPRKGQVKCTVLYIFFYLCFHVPAGHAVHHKQKKLQNGLLHKANDWKIIVNLEEFNYIFPPEIIPTSLRPDVVVWSNPLQRAIIIELTRSAEEGIEVAHIQKESKYLPLIAEITTSSTGGQNYSQ